MAGKGVVAPEKIKSRHFENWKIYWLYGLTVYIRKVISFSYKPGKIPIFRIFLAKFSILAYI